jgi:diguanylate cyclase (GGDEF)-like protein/PAS domain S-box-containing protein
VPKTTTRDSVDFGPSWQITGLVAFVAALAVLIAAPKVTDLTILWPANAIILASVLLGRGDGKATARIIAGVAATFFANLISGGAIGLALGYAAANGVEVTIAALLLNEVGTQRRPLERLDSIGIFALVAGLIAPAAGAVAGAGAAQSFGNEAFADVFAVWFRSCALGALLINPTAIILWRSYTGRAPQTPTENVEKLASTIVVAAVTIISFALPLPLLFVPLAAMVIVTIRRGWLGAVNSMLVVATVGVAYTLTGHGPIAQLVAPGIALTFLQFYIVSCFFTVLAVASLLAERQRLTRQILSLEARYRLLSDHSADALLHVDRDGTCLYASPASGDLIGVAASEIEGTNLTRFVHAKDRQKLIDTHRNVIDNPGISASCRYRVTHSNGVERWQESRTRGIHDEYGVATSVVSVIRDVTEDMAREATLSIAASTDSLTGLANRRTFEESIALFQQQGSDAKFAVAMLDLDHFKRVNDRHGHATGDEVLRQVAMACSHAVRGNDVVARLGGEEFALLLTDADNQIAAGVAERVRKAIEQLRIPAADGQIVTITSSVGIAFAQPGLNAIDLLANADTALYKAKVAGRNRMRIAA